MTVGILEVTRVAAVERRLRRLHDRGAGALGLTHQIVDLGFGGDVVGEGEFGGARWLLRQAAVRGEAPPRPERELQARLQLEERDGSVLEFGSDDPLRGQAHAVPVERDGPVEVVDAERDERDAWLHGRWPQRAPVRLGTSCR